MEIALLKGLREIVGDTGQIWMATHSLTILSHLEADEIFMVQQGKITPPSRTVLGDSLKELMGLEEHIDKLKDFINSISDWVYINFITQCFEAPEVIQSALKNDPQVEAFKTFLGQLTNGIALLDFGAGKGRLVKEVRTEVNEQKYIEISALEPEKALHEALSTAGIIKIYQTPQELQDNSFDVIVLCNVLHEIPVKQWLETCNNIKRALKNEGYLLIIEDRTLPRGEKIGEEGFHILDLESIKALFSLTKLPSSISPTEKKYRERILCCPIPAKNIQEVSITSLKNCLRSLEISIMKDIKKLRSTQNNEFSNAAKGRLAAFHSQHYINTLLAIEGLSDLDN